MAIIATGIDFAKNVFAVHGVDRGGVVQLRQPKVGRAPNWMNGSGGESRCATGKRSFGGD